MTNVINLHLFFPMTIGLVAFICYLIYRLFIVKFVVEKENKTQNFFEKIFNKTVDSNEKTIDKFVDYSKSIKFTVAHEMEIHEIETKLKEIEKKLDTICAEQKQKENINILEE